MSGLLQGNAMGQNRSTEERIREVAFELFSLTLMKDREAFHLFPEGMEGQDHALGHAR